MSEDDSAIRRMTLPISGQVSGLGWGLLGVVAFSFTVPFTRVAVQGLSPLFIGGGRAVVAGVLASAALALTGQAPPSGRQWLRLMVVACGVVVGFPLLTSFALRTVPASHGAVVIALLPAATAVMAVLRGRERPPGSFWIMAAVGASVAVGFASLQGGGVGHLRWPDALLFAAVAAGAVGYAEGGLLARELGSWQTVSWALVVAFPVMVTLAAVAAAQHPPHATAPQWAAFAYLSLVSMYLGFFAWYRGLAIGPMSTVSQIQLSQPVLTITWAAVLLNERLTWTTMLGGLAVIACAAISVRARITTSRNKRTGRARRTTH